MRGRQAVDSGVHRGRISGSRQPGLILLNRCYTPPMFGKVKRLRASGKRLSSHDIGRSDYVEGEVRVYSLAGAIVASVSNPAAQVSDSLLPDLYDAKLITMNEHGMLFKGEERPQGDAGPAFIQEWSVMVER